MKKRRHYFIFTFLLFVIVSTFTIAYSITFNNINYSYDTNHNRKWYIKSWIKKVKEKHTQELT